ncbi:hypothetical protein B0H11DRAFT_1051100 [Mycena galericulata]|nr:hypothetical protein B0H11DRAFT_1051100 [Mycena galericulata]
MDPFVVISFGEVFRMGVIRHSLNPVWDEKLFFHVCWYEIGYEVRWLLFHPFILRVNDGALCRCPSWCSSGTRLVPPTVSAPASACARCCPEAPQRRTVRRRRCGPLTDGRKEEGAAAAGGGDAGIFGGVCRVLAGTYGTESSRGRREVHGGQDGGLYKIGCRH